MRVVYFAVMASQVLTNHKLNYYLRSQWGVPIQATLTSTSGVLERSLQKNFSILGWGGTIAIET